MKRVVVYGDLNLDIIYFVEAEDLYLRDVSYISRGAVVQPGGVAGNFSVAIRRLDIPAKPLSTVGYDVVADLLLKNLEDERVETKLVSRVREEPTGVMSIIVTPSGRRTIIGYRGANKYNVLDEGRISQALSRADYVFIYGFVVNNIDDSRSLVELVNYAAREGVGVGVDIGGIPRSKASILLQIRGKVSHLFVNIDELAEVLGYASLEAAEYLYKALEPKALFLKMGSQGAVAYYDGKRIYKPAFKVRAIDTTGCGDAFNAGVVYAILNDYDYEDALLLGNAMGSYKAQGIGPKYLPSSLKELEDFIEIHKEALQLTGN